MEITNFKLLNLSTMDRLQWRVTVDGIKRRTKPTQSHSGEWLYARTWISEQWHRFSMKLLLNSTNLFNRIMAFLLLETHLSLFCLQFMHHHLSLWFGIHQAMTILNGRIHKFHGSSWGLRFIVISLFDDVFFMIYQGKWLTFDWFWLADHSNLF